MDRTEKFTLAEVLTLLPSLITWEESYSRNGEALANSGVDGRERIRRMCREASRDADAVERQLEEHPSVAMADPLDSLDD